MRKLFTIVLLMLFTCFTPSYGQPINKQITQLDEGLSIKEIDTNVYMVTHSFPWSSNSLVIKFTDGKYLFIDTPYTDDATEKIVHWLIERDSVKIKITAINTHFHNDRLGGNGYLKSIGSAIYGSDLTVKLLKERGLGNGMLDMLKDPSMQKYYTYWQNVKLTPPDKLFSLQDGLILSFDNDTVEVYYPGPGHTPDNLVVYYPKKKILFGGCFIKSIEADSKGFVGDADLNSWFSSLHNLLNKYPDPALVIPGHGSIGGKELITHTMELVK
jgi:glyoxylase-like metal-dependent hydrolase (beta-lactamase superfamily II)